MTELTARQAAILNFVRDFCAEWGWAPSYAEIGAAVGLVSSSSVDHQLKRLAGMGLLRLGGGQRMVAIHRVSPCESNTLSADSVGQLHSNSEGHPFAADGPLPNPRAPGEHREA